MVLGIDIGSTTISAVLLDRRGEVAWTFYEFHSGQIGRGLQKLTDTLPPGCLPRIALTSSSRLNLDGIESTDIDTIIKIGGQGHEPKIPADK